MPYKNPEDQKRWRERNKGYMDRWHQEHAEHSKNYRQRNTSKLKASQQEYLSNCQEARMLTTSKNRAKTEGLDHTITVEDIIIPRVCPVLGIELEIGKGKNNPSSPSLDRIDSSKGYTPDNVWVISYRANTLKNNATPSELILLARAIAAKTAHGFCDLPETFVASFIPT